MDISRKRGKRGTYLLTRTRTTEWRREKEEVRQRLRSVGIVNTSDNSGKVLTGNICSNATDQQPSQQFPDRNEGDGDGDSDSYYNDVEADAQPSSRLSGLATWAIENRISHQGVRSLLTWMASNRIEGLPKDPRTLLKTPRTVDITASMHGKEKHYFFHFGLIKTLEHLLKHTLDMVDSDTVLKLQLNIDGMPPYKSTGTQIWPILGILHSDTLKSPVFCLSVHYGGTKPKDVISLLGPLLLEYARGLVDNEDYAEFDIHGRTVKLKITTVICDAPARAFIKQMKAYNGKCGCDKCEAEGKHIAKRHSFMELDAARRTDESFRDRRNPEHHHNKITRSPFEMVEMGMVSQFPVDYMHAVLCGVMKKLLQLWRDNVCIGINNWEEISRGLRICAKYAPSEFQRRPRPLSQLDRFKATEFRYFVCYTGPVLFMGLLGKKADASNRYRHYLMLFCAMRILLNPKVVVTYADYAEKLLIGFVKEYSNLYGDTFVTYNVHVLIHLAQEAIRHGALDKISAFPYESYMFKLKRMIRRPDFTLNQCVKRIYEERAIEDAAGTQMRPMKDKPIKYCSAHQNGPVEPHVQPHVLQEYKVCYFRGTKFSVYPRDRAVSVDGEIGLIQNIIRRSDKRPLAVIKTYNVKVSFFSAPMHSAHLGVFRVAELGNTHKTVLLSRCKKVWLTQRSAKLLVAVELMHE